MNWKVVTAFVGGALIASGIVYVAVKTEPAAPPIAEAPKPVVARVVDSPAAAPTAAPQPAQHPPPAQFIAPPEPVAPHRVAAPRLRVREKPSPMPPPMPRNSPPVVARVQPPVPLEPVARTPAQVPVQEVPVPTPTPAPSVPAPPIVQQPATVENAVSITQSPEVRTPHMVTLAAGTALSVRIGETVSSSHNLTGDIFLATLEQPLVIDGWIIAERGARVEGRVLDATPAGRGGGTSRLEIDLVKLSTADGQRIRIHTVPYKKNAESSTGSNAAKVGAGTVLGAVIGAVAGGGKGAAIGAGAGAGAGGGAVLLTRGKPAEIPVETRLGFRVQDPVTITEKLD